MQKEVMILFSMVVVVALVGLIVIEGMPSDSDDLTGHGSLRKKLKKIRHQLKAEVKRVEHQVSAEVKRFEGRVEAEAKRFGNRVEAEWKRFDDRLSAELQRTSDKTEAEFKRYNDRIEAEINRVDDNIKEFWKKEIEAKVKAELDRLLRRVKNEVDAQRGVFKNLAKGNVCSAYNSATKSDAYNINQLIYDQLMPPIKGAIRPHVQAIIAPVIPIVQAALAHLNLIPVVGTALHAALAPVVTAYMQVQMPEDLSENAAKKAIREALEECQ